MAPVRCESCCTQPLGSLVVDEVIVPVVDLYLDHGAFVTISRLHGPLPAVDTRDYVLHDRAGRAVFRSQGHHRLAWPAMPEGGEVFITCEVRVDGVIRT